VEIYNIGLIFLTGSQYDIDGFRSRLLQSDNPRANSDINQKLPGSVSPCTTI
jgi:hypothetical protein